MKFSIFRFCREKFQEKDQFEIKKKVWIQQTTKEINVRTFVFISNIEFSLFSILVSK